MKLRYMTRFGAISVLSIGMLGGIQAQEVEGKAKIGDAEGKATINLPQEETDTDRPLRRDRLSQPEGVTAAHSQVTKIHKASSLTGMDVFNHQNEKLGDVKDIVMDLPSGKISYVVLSVGGFLGIGDKLIAVPPSAFSFTPNRDGLLLDADKAKIEAAPGFVQTAWPDVNDPEFSSYWQIKDRDAVGGAGAVETREKRGSNLDRDNDKKNIDVDADVDLKRD